MATQTQPARDTVLPQRERRRRWRRVILTCLLGITLGIGAGFGYFYWQTAASLRAALPKWPPQEEDALDPLVAKAIEAEREKVLLHPFASAVWGRLGMVYYAHEYEADAALCFIQAEKLDPKEPRWQYLHGLILIHSDHDAGIQKIERAANLCDETNLVPRVRLGELQLQVGHLDQAEQQFQAVIQKDQGNARAHLGLARVCAHRGDLDKSIEHVQFSVNAPIGQRGSHDLLAELYQRRGDKERVEEHRKAADRVQRRQWPDPFVDEAKRLQTGLQRFLEIAGALLHENRIPDALKLLQTTTQQYPKSERAWILMAKAHAREKDWSAAEQSVSRALRQSPDYVEGLYVLGVILFEKGDCRAAVEPFSKAIELKPDSAESYYLLGLCQAKINERQGAIDAFEMALRCQPSMPQAHRALGEELAAAGRPLEALIHLQAALRLKPNDAQAKNLIRKSVARVYLPVVP
jgi:tetratricopeptide (TPR) repeat protein